MNTVKELRESLFAQMEKLSQATEETLPSEISRAEAVVMVSQSVIESCKVKNEFLRIAGGVGSGFIPVNHADVKQLNSAHS